MSQYKAQLCAILDVVPKSLRLTTRVTQAAMVNILGGAAADSHDKLVAMAETEYIDGTDIYLHLYGKASKPGRKIGHITFTTLSPHVDLLGTIGPFINEVDAMRRERLDASAKQLRPDADGAHTSDARSAGEGSRNARSPLVVVTMGSDSDLSVLSAGLDVLERFGVPYDCTITSAHRTPARMAELGRAAAARGVKVLIAAAGGAAHLPGMLASETTVPVIGVPVKATHLDGNDSLLSIVQMPVSARLLGLCFLLIAWIRRRPLQRSGWLTSTAQRGASLWPRLASTTRQMPPCSPSASSVPTTPSTATAWRRTWRICGPKSRPRPRGSRTSATGRTWRGPRRHRKVRCFVRHRLVWPPSRLLALPIPLIVSIYPSNMRRPLDLACLDVVRSTADGERGAGETRHGSLSLAHIQMTGLDRDPEI